jgi:hypothetical protein
MRNNSPRSRGSKPSSRNYRNSFKWCLKSSFERPRVAASLAGNSAKKHVYPTLVGGSM